MLYLRNKAVSYWRNTKGGKSNQKLKSVQTKFKHVKSKHDLCRWGSHLKNMDDWMQNWKQIQNYAFQKFQGRKNKIRCA